MGGRGVSLCHCYEQRYLWKLSSPTLHVFPKRILKQALVFFVCLRLFLGKSEKNILALPSLKFHVPSS